MSLSPMKMQTEFETLRKKLHDDILEMSRDIDSIESRLKLIERLLSDEELEDDA